MQPETCLLQMVLTPTDMLLDPYLLLTPTCFRCYLFQLKCYLGNPPNQPWHFKLFLSHTESCAHLFVVMGFSAAHHLRSWLQSLPKPEPTHPTSAGVSGTLARCWAAVSQSCQPEIHLATNHSSSHSSATSPSTQCSEASQKQPSLEPWYRASLVKQGVLLGGLSCSLGCSHTHS